MVAISPIIQPEELLRLKQSNEGFILIDADGGGKERYLAKHLDGAHYLDLEQDLSAVEKDPANGGRHPLPPPSVFAKTISELGINADSKVVIYDDKNGANAAARLWWMLRAIGYEKVQVLNKGFKGAEEIGFPTNAEIPTPIPVAIDPFVNEWKWPTKDILAVKDASRTTHQTIVDVRAKERFDGIVEPLDLIAGHIPNAINIPLTDNLDGTGGFKDPNLLREKYENAFENFNSENIIVHCGSGVTACHTLLAFDYAGLPMPNLYVGSWSEWSRSGNEMVLKQ
ncbi:sulfurtransferase [Nubsella zeaxanthinifaciens]|jgi:thiosulfate/3-mercaptopyruvate sulfurtransferase|uniref:sulfurtransferase n=1 Tax=Nubsella zeaxanthinifaciens TaxID=392412 RepID=UPI000DE29EB1|nr:sulfurtransferase [Nubsella zeaxanthinifaciens]